ncbi:MAG: hypothetical protein K1X53_10770 [Candidatus Sumerlaeaceae bacterium]|nr:hypothetical protein [Candidatus Sumerlaeaceae bacterium]
MAVLCAALALVTGMAGADKLYHSDGTVVEGRILEESPDVIKVETTYGTLKYDKVDLIKIERTPPAGSTPVAVVQATPAVKSLAGMLPKGPINPFAPPAYVNLVDAGGHKAPPVTTATVTAKPTPAPGAPAAATPSPASGLPPNI